jgi:hypothetical protein
VSHTEHYCVFKNENHADFVVDDINCGQFTLRKETLKLRDIVFFCARISLTKLVDFCYW